MNGRVQVETVGSVVLKGNPLGDPRVREVPVYLPPSYGDAFKKGGKRFPLIINLPGFPGTGRGALAYNPWKENLAERFDRLIAAGKAQECVLAFADCFTAYGGSQYLNSSATGRYEDHVLELASYFTDKFGLVDSPSGRALLGKSSGGFGALTLGMRHPDVFGHVAAHAGDMAFELCYGRDLAKLVVALDKHGGSLERLVKAFRASKTKAEFPFEAINALAMSACYSPNPKSRLGFDLPCDARTAERIPEIWKRWLAVDPVVCAPRYARNLKKLETLFFDAGRRDEYFLQLGARKLAAVLKKAGVRFIHEEHDFGHMDMNDRYDRSLSLLSARLSR